MNKFLIGLCCLICLSPALAQAPPGGDGEEAHLHGPDGRHIAVASTFGPAAGQKSILSHHDLRVADENDRAILGCQVHSVIHQKGNPNVVIHKERNAYEPENEVYGSHMMYRAPGEYEITETITFPDKTTQVVTFPVWVPDPTGGKTAREEAASSNPFLWLWGAGSLVAIGAAFALGLRRGRKDASALSLLVAASLALPPALAQEPGGDGEEAHLHGPDGRHIAVASTFGAVQIPLKAFPTADGKERASKTVGKYRLRLSIENEEMALPDPDVVPVSAALAKTLELASVPVTAQRGGDALSTIGQVQRNPNRFVTVSARVGGRIVRVGVTPGDRVQAGQLVAELDSPELGEAQSALAQSRGSAREADSALRTAEARLREAEQEEKKAQADRQAAQGHTETSRKALERQKQLARAGAFAQPALEAARTALVEADGELTQASSVQSAAEKTAARLSAGLESGVVARKDVEAVQTALTQAQARVATAQKQAETARATHEREERLAREGLRDAREIETAQGQVRASEAALQSADAVVASQRKRLIALRSIREEAAAARSKAYSQIEAARQKLLLLGSRESAGSRVRVTAPLGGEVETRPVNAGESVAAGAPLASILNIDDVWIESQVFEKDLTRVRVGQEVTIVADALPGRTFRGRIATIGGEVNPETRTVKVRTVVVNPGERLKPHMFVHVLLGSGGGRTLLVPRSAVLEEGSDSVVFLRESEDSCRRVVVTLGGTVGEQVIVRSGLTLGQKVITTGAYQLQALARKGG